MGKKLSCALVVGISCLLAHPVAAGWSPEHPTAGNDSAEQSTKPSRSAPPSTEETNPTILHGGSHVTGNLKGKVDSFSIYLGAGDFLKAHVSQSKVDVAIATSSPGGAHLGQFDNTPFGDEAFTIEADVAGYYRIGIERGSPNPYDSGGGDADDTYALVVDEVSNAADHEREVRQTASDRGSTAAWLARNFVPLSSDHQADNRGSLRRLGRDLSGVTVVGLGEAAHGSHEIYSTKARVVRYLISNLGFRVLACELDFPATTLINDYVNGGQKPFAFALKEWDTDEFLDLIEWIRRFNAELAPSQRVKIVGVDVQDRAIASEALIDYIGRTAPDRLSSVRSLFKDKSFPTHLSPEESQRLSVGFEDLYAYMEFNGPELIQRSSRSRYLRMLYLARAFSQTGRIFPSAQGSVVGESRDLYMADNVGHALDQEPPGTRLVFWAHNMHVGVLPNGTSTGDYLRTLYGDKYFSIGITFGTGQVQSWTNNYHNLTAYDTLTPTSDSTEALLSVLPGDEDFVDLRNAPRSGPIATWLDTPAPMRAIGHTYDLRVKYVTAILPPRSFDGLLYVRRSSRARPSVRMQAKYPDVPAPSGR